MLHLAKEPKYMVIAEKIRGDILSGSFPPGSKLPPDEVIAKAYGINKRTVAAGMSQLVAEGLITRAPGRGSIVIRQKVVDRHTDSICCITWSSGDLYETLEEEITKETLKRGFYPVWVPQALLSRGVDSPDNKQLYQFMEYTMNSMPHGMLIYGERFIPYDMIERNRAKCGHLVFLWDYSNQEEIPAKYVLVDYVSAAEKVVNHFLKNGHTKMTLLTTPVEDVDKFSRKPPQYTYHKALENACADAGIEYDSEIPKMLWNERSQTEVFQTILRRKITAAAMASDAAYYFHYQNVINQLKIRIPEDLSLIGFYNIEQRAPDMTTLNVDIHKMAATAAEMLFENDNETRKVYIEPELIERKTVFNRLKK